MLAGQRRSLANRGVARIPTPMHALTAQHLTRRFGDRVAVDDVSFELAAGEIFALLGPNGAGKTTTLRMLAGLIAPTAGSVQVGGDRMTPDAAPGLRQRIGFLTEAPGLWDTLTVQDNLGVYARLYGLADPDSAVKEALALFGLADRGRDRTARLSKGLKQRVALARAIVHKPRIVLLDEPTAGLDPESARGVRELIVGMRREGRAVLLCTHNLDEVERVADRVAVLRSRLVAVGTPGELRQRQFTTRLQIRLSEAAEPFAAVLLEAGIAEAHSDGTWLSLAAGPRTTPDIVRILVAAGAGIEAVAREEPSLEDVYIKLLHASGGQADHPEGKPE
jgi:ABC-2 type transport system ATP-binding protein